MKFLTFLILCLLLLQCGVKTKIVDNTSYATKIDTITYFDNVRNRPIPVAIYQPNNPKLANGIPIIFSHGYGENRGKDYIDAYNYLVEFLASKGYFVVSVQHELKNDELLAMTGKLSETRMPNWERGAQNILFALNQMKANYPQLNYKKLVLIGHSNGGDMTVLFGHKYPDLVDKMIAMDNRRMTLPLTSQPKIYTLRSNDYPADEGVLPTDVQKTKYKMTVDFTNINHSSMDNDATGEEREYLTQKILQYLKD